VGPQPAPHPIGRGGRQSAIPAPRVSRYVRKEFVPAAADHDALDCACPQEAGARPRRARAVRAGVRAGPEGPVGQAEGERRITGGPVVKTLNRDSLMDWMCAPVCVRVFACICGCEQNIKYFKIYRWDPETKGKPYEVTYPVDLDEYVGIRWRSLGPRRGLMMKRMCVAAVQMRTHGAGRAAQDQERAGPDADVPPVRRRFNSYSLTSRPVVLTSGWLHSPAVRAARASAARAP